MEIRKMEIDEIIATRQAILDGLCTNHSGKMKNKVSYSTSKKLNKFCEIRSQNKNLICSECYAEDTINRYENLENKLARNHALITKECLSRECFPLLNYLDIRLEAFGDIATIKQVYNYFTWAEVNKRTFFVLWTKNPFLIKKAMDQYGIEKPSNFRIIFSSCHLNSEQAAIIKRLYPFVDKIFTVYTADFAINNDVEINCGGNSCQRCGRCYDPNNGEFFINEMLKKDQSKFKKMCDKLKKFLQIA